MNIVTLTAFDEELGLIKESGAGAALGTLGAGLTAIHGGLKEWDRRAAERQALSRMTTEQQQQVSPLIQQARLHRLKRLGVNTALAGAAGGLVGHYGSKAAVHLTDSMSKKLTENLKPASEHAADVLGKGFSKGMSEGGAKLVDKAKGESKGFLGRLFFGKK
jgi:hypothetical protein